MEVLKLSRFKLQLRTLISEVQDLRERERSVTEQLNLSIKKQKQSEDEFGKRVKELESELESSIDFRRKLERKVNYLQNDNSQLENKQKELNGTIQALLQSKEHFVNAYRESTNESRRSAETKDRKLKILSEKLKSHLLLFDSIEKEALSVKQAVASVQNVVSEKEEVVSSLKRKFDRVSEVEKVFIGKISEMEVRLQKYKDELRRKDVIITELEVKLEAERNSERVQSQIDDLQKSLTHKEAIIQNLQSEKQALDSEVKSLVFVLEKIQHAFREMNKDKEAFISVVEIEKKSTLPGEEMNRTTGFKVDTANSLPAVGGSSVRTDYSQHNQSDAYTLAEFSEKRVPEFQAEEASISPSVLTGGPLAPKHIQHAQVLNQPMMANPRSFARQRLCPQSRHASWNRRVQQLRQTPRNTLAKL